jgi:hypothetical protein
MNDRLCGLVVRVLGYRFVGYRFGGPCSIPGSTRFSGGGEGQVVGLERGPLSLVSTTEELLDKKSSGSYLENREYGRRGPSRWPCGTLYLQQLATTSPRSGSRSVGIVHSRTQTMEFVLFVIIFFIYFSTCTELSHWPRGTLYPQKLALTSPTSNSRSLADSGHGFFFP